MIAENWPLYGAAICAVAYTVLEIRDRVRKYRADRAASMQVQP